jgi:hypothetical protein
LSLQADIAIQALTAAAQSADGIRLRIDPVSPGILQPTSRAKQILYQHKKDNSEFTQLVIKFDPVDPEHYLWIYPGKDS